MFIERDLSRRLISYAQEFPAIVLTGARQTGKTTLLKSLFSSYSYVTLDRPAEAERADKDPELFLSLNKAPLIVDEIQYAPNLFRHLKIQIDENRDLKGQYILTGSQKFPLMKEVSDSLAGRCGILELEGLSSREIRRAHLDVDFEELLVRGGLPELWKERTRDERAFLNSYIASYLERDVRQILAVGNLRDFDRFLRACATRSGQVLNRSDLARDVGISVPTVGEWLGVLEASNQVQLLEPWFGNIGKRLVKSPKIYFSDTGLLCALLGVSFAQVVNTAGLIGPIWETYVFSELRKVCASFGEGRLWFYRDRNQKEIDFILEIGTEIHLIECKWTESPSVKDTQTIKTIETLLTSQLKDRIRVGKKLVLSRVDGAFPLTKDIYGCDIESLWRMLKM